MHGTVRPVIIPGMLPRTERVPGGRALRYAWVVIAVLAALFVGVAGVDGRADAESYDPEELQFLELINGYRADHGLRALVLSDTLAVAAEHHSRDMARYSFFAHNTAGSSYYAAGSKPWDRMEAEGYRYNTYKGENIAVGYETAEEAFRAWRESPSHNQAMLDDRYRVIGIARINEPGSVHGWYGTTDFGGGPGPPSPAPGESPKADDQPAPERRNENGGPPQDRAGVGNGGVGGG